MFTIVLIIIYVAFISLGLPDSLLGTAWPVMQGDLGASFGAAGVISMVISGGTIVSSFLSGRVIKRFGTGKVTMISVAMTAIALFGFSFAPSFVWLCVAAIPLGLGAGSVDAALNSFVALHYKANHMSWLHCFWGVGATLGPIILSLFIAKENGWKKGYFTISIIQFCLVIVLFLTLPLWKKVKSRNETEEEKEEDIVVEKQNVYHIRGVKLALVSFVLYCATETTTGLWGSSYLVNHKGLSADRAALWISFFYAGITFARFLTGFLTMRFHNRILIRVGQIVCAIGTVFLILPLPTYFGVVGFILIGMGCAPIYPCMLHETPKRFGKGASQSIMGIQMAFAYMGSSFMPPILGFLVMKTNIVIFPYFLLVCALVMLLASEKLNGLLMKDNNK